MKLRTPLAHVRGLGSAKHGTQHWWHQRLTAIALIPLSLWFISSLLRMTTMDHATVSQWIGIPINSVLLIVLIIVLFHHAQLGMQIVIEDYIDTEWQKIANIILVKFLAGFAGIASIIAVLKVLLGI